MKTCENCGIINDGSYGSGRFCTNKCARGFSTKNKRSEINAKISNTLKGRSLSEECKKKIGEKISKVQTGKSLSEEHKRNIAKGVKKSIQDEIKQVNSIMNVSKRTITKILERMNLGCSRCGWNESTCDIHHINGRKVENCDNHDNLSLLCPNCHRLVHTNKIKKEELISLVNHVGDKWKEYYYWND
jgi:hypothetical protein